MDTLFAIVDFAFDLIVAYTVFAFWRDFADRHESAV